MIRNFGTRSGASQWFLSLGIFWGLWLGLISTGAANDPGLSLAQTNGQWRLHYRLPESNGWYQVISASKVEELAGTNQVFLEMDARQTNGGLWLTNFYQQPARFFKLRHRPAKTNAPPALFELPAAAPFLASHPMIFDGRLYVHTTVMPGQICRQYLSCYDLRQDRQLLWSTVLGENLFTMDLMDKISWNLIRSEDVIPLVVYDATKKQRFLLVDALSGEIRANNVIGTQWPYVDPRGRLRYGSVLPPTGNVAEHGEELLFPNGTMLCKCSGDVAWANQGWILFGSDAIVVRDAAFGFDSGASLKIKAIDLSCARDALTGFLETGEAVLFKTDADSTLANSYTTDHFLISQGRIYKGRIYTAAMAGPEPGLYLEEFSATNGAFLRRALVPGDPQAPESLQWGNPGVTGYMQQSGSRLLLPFAGLISGFPGGQGCRIRAFDTSAMAPAWSYTYAGTHTHAIPSRDNLLLVEEIFAASGSQYLGFRVRQVDLATGALKATFEDAAYTNRSDYRPSSLGLSASSAICMEKQPLLYEGSLYLPVQGQKGAAFWIIDVQDTSAHVLQYKFNNQLNPVLNLTQPASNQVGDVLPVKEGAAEDSTASQTNLFATMATNSVAVDQPAQPELVPAILSSLGLAQTNVDQMARGYVATLARVEFSNNGEDSQNNIGEGYLRLRTKFGCDQTAMRYPWRGFLGLHYEPASIFNGHQPGPDFRAYAPHMPLFHRPDYSLDGANASLHLAYSALEDDDYDSFGKIQLFAKRIATIALSVMAGDYCRVAEVVSDAAAQEANDYTESFGAPFVTIFNGAADEVPNLFGIPAGATENELPCSASASRGVLVAAAQAVQSACAIADLANGDVSSLGNVANSTIDVFSDSEDSTRGAFHLRVARMLRVKTLSVTLNRVDIQGTPLQTTLNARVGLMSADSLSSTPTGAVSAYETPFASYVKREAVLIPSNQPMTNTLYTATLSLASTSHGSTGVYTELDIETMGAAFNFGSAVHSETRFFEDILRGAWEQDASNRKKFRKTVVQPLNSRTLQGAVTLTYEVLLDP